MTVKCGGRDRGNFIRLRPGFRAETNGHRLNSCGGPAFRQNYIEAEPFKGQTQLAGGHLVDRLFQHHAATSEHFFGFFLAESEIFDEFVFGCFKVEDLENFPLVNDVIVYAHASFRLRFLTLLDSKQFSENHTIRQPKGNQIYFGTKAH